MYLRKVKWCSLPVLLTLLTTLWLYPVTSYALSLQEAIHQIKTTYSAKVLKAETVNLNGKKHYRIKFLTKDRRVKNVTVDGNTGDIISDQMINRPRQK